MVAGPTFKYRYNGGLFFIIYHSEVDTHFQPTWGLNYTVYFESDLLEKCYIATKVIGIPQLQYGIYTLQCLEYIIIIDLPESCIYPSKHLTITSETLKYNGYTLPAWVRRNSPSTIFVPAMRNSARGTFKYHQDDSWYLHPGYTQATTKIFLISINVSSLSFNPTKSPVAIYQTMQYTKNSGKSTFRHRLSAMYLWKILNI